MSQLQNLLSQKSFPWMTPLALSLAVLTSSGCTNDNAGTVRVVKEKAEETKKEDVKKTSYNVLLTTPMNGAAVEIYDLKYKKSLGTAKVQKSNTPKDAANPTAIEKALQVTMEINDTDVQSDSLLITTITAPTSGEATYYDPVVNALVPLSKNDGFVALSTATSINPSPLTTLAMYRTLGRLGWFFIDDNANRIPTISEMTSFLTGQDSRLVQRQYSLALSEVVDSLNVKGLSPAENRADIISFSSDGAQINASISGWLYMLAHLDIYDDQPGASTSAPFMRFAPDMAKDFLDGDIDGQTLAGLGNVTIKLTPEFKPNNTQRTNQSLYENQFSVLNSYEALLAQKVRALGNTLGTSGSTNFKDFIAGLDNTDPAFFPVQEVTVEVGSPISGRGSNVVRVAPANDKAAKMNVTYIDTNSANQQISITKTESVVDGKPKTIWKSSTTLPKSIILDPSIGALSISNALLKEASKVIATNVDKAGAVLGTTEVFALNNRILTYSDFSRPSRQNGAFFGIGNKNRALTFDKNTTSRTKLNADETAVDANRRLLQTDIDNLVGKYTGSGCQLIIDTTGKVTLTTGETSHTTLIDRELGDNIHAINSAALMLNVSSKNNDTSQRRFIQIKVIDQRPVSASTAIAESANASELSSPDGVCSF